VSAMGGTPVRIRGAGRTDAGVHALGQVVAFDTDRNIPARGWQLGLHRYLPEDIRVQSALISAESRFSTSIKTGIDAFSGFHIGGYFIYPESRGELHADSLDAHNAPKIHANYLSAPLDREMIVAVLKVIRKIAAQPALAKIVVRETRPGPTVATDDELLDYARRTAQTCWHPTGTCKMGTGPDAVVDPELRVHRMQGLRVIDMSVVPFITASNTNIPTFMIAERGADLVLRDAAAARHPAN